MGEVETTAAAPTSAETTAAAIVADARAMFEHYLAATPSSTFVRSIWQPEKGHHFYPEPTIQADAGAFAGVFTCLWRALEVPGMFARYYADKSAAFVELARIVKPNDDGYAAHARFWVQDGASLVRRVPSDADTMKRLCKTLRDGFSHFNFRYINDTPKGYFERLRLVLPSAIPEPTVANSHRIFICDWIPKKSGRRLQFMDADSDSRVIETHFAHFRYHLFCFLARFFAEPGGASYHDILTLQPLAVAS
jgi:hypothetical protein